MTLTADDRVAADDRVSAGRAARKAVPRSDHGGWRPADDRPDPVEILERQAATRVRRLVPIRYGRMLASPLAFYRGAAAVMAADLAAMPSTGLNVQLCGDAHLSNFGTFAGPDRRLVFDLNDFDETLPGPFEWDVKRLVASFVVAARDLGLPEAEEAEAARTAARSYRQAMRRFAGMRTLDVWYARLDVDDLLAQWRSRATARDAAKADRQIAKARTKDSARAVSKLTELVDGRPRFRHEPPLLIPVSELVSGDDVPRTAEMLRGWLRRYRASVQASHRALLDRFSFADMAHKVVGVGSVGARAWIVLLLGRDERDALILQVKEAQASVLEPHLGRSPYKEHGRRVVEGQRFMQAASDILLGWASGEGLDGVHRDFYVRQLWDAKGSADFERMTRSRLSTYAELCGRALARAHARSGDPVAIGAYLGGSDRFDRAMAAFAIAYADRNAEDFAALARAVDAGRVEARAGL